MSDAVTLDICDNLAVITLDRPERNNVADLAFAQQLNSATIACDENSAVRAVLLRSRGRMFCAGGDLSTFSDPDVRLGSLLRMMATHAHGAVSRLRRMQKPVVCAVQGPAAGIGVGLAVAADILIAADSATFTLGYAGLGLTPDGGATALLPRMIGLRRTQQMLYSNMALSARQAAEWGLVTETCADEELEDVARKRSEQLAAGPTHAFGAMKRLLIENNFETQLELEARSIAAMSATSNGREGIAAFRARRRPVFEGP